MTTTKTAAQIDAEFEAAFKEIQPAQATKPLTVADVLAPYRKVILKQRRRGYSWTQIAEVMSRPPISEKTTRHQLCEAFGDKKAAPRSPAAAAQPAQPPVLPAPASLRSAPNVAAPAAPTTPPMTAKEAAAFMPLFEGLIPPIVKTKANRQDARTYAANAVEQFRPADAERFQTLLAAELDALNETNCSRYGVPPETIKPWKRRWS